MMYGYSEILEQPISLETSKKIRVIARIIRLWNEYKKRKLLKSFDEVEPNVFVLKQEIIEKVKTRARRVKVNQIKKLNN